MTNSKLGPIPTHRTLALKRTIHFDGGCDQDPINRQACFDITAMLLSMWLEPIDALANGNYFLFAMRLALPNVAIGILPLFLQYHSSKLMW